MTSRLPSQVAIGLKAPRPGPASEDNAPLPDEKRAGWITDSYVRRILEGADKLDPYTETFRDLGINDFWLPLPKQTIQYAIRDPSIEREFYRRQREHSIEVWQNSDSKVVQHVFCEDGDDFMKSEKILGEGGFAIVDQVRIPTQATSVVCARKKIGRVRQFKAQKQLIEAFVRELGVMRLVNHHHCTQLVGSYTDYDYLAILSLPIADMDLAAYLDLEHLASEQLQVIRRGMGCLCGALAYLHERQIRHEDLKPQNVLIHGENVLLTDFGFSLDFSDDSVSTTTGRPSHWTARYCAPESLDYLARNRATDIWGLGCILIEMLSRLCGNFRLSYIKRFWKETGSGHASYALNPVATSEWNGIMLRHISLDCKLTTVYFCVQQMLALDRHRRPTARQVLEKMADLDDLFHGILPLLNSCCYPGVPRSPSMVQADLTLPPGYFYPQFFKNFAFVLADMNGNVIRRSKNLQSRGDPTPLSGYFESPDIVVDICWHEWNVRLTATGTLSRPPDEVDLALASYNITPMSTTVSYNVRCNVWAGSQFVPRMVQIVLIPICFPRSQLYGSHCVLVTFALEEGPVFRAELAKWFKDKQEGGAKVQYSPAEEVNNLVPPCRDGDEQRDLMNEYGIGF